MSNKTIEAILRISAKMGDMKALRTLQNHLSQIDRQAKDINRTQSMMGRLNTNAANATGLLASRMLAPGVLAYGAGRALGDFADLERQLTRTGLKLNGTREEMAALYEDARRAGRSVGLLTTEVVGTIDAYAETGASLGDIKSDIKTLTEAQQALGADGRDVVNVWDAARKSFGLMGSEAKRFFGSIGAGGAAGKFEGSDMAAHFPSLLPVASVAGFKGIEGIDRMVAFAETMRDFTGTSGEAATAMGDFLSKIDSPDVQRNFAKFGIDLEKRLKKARASGEDILSTMRNIMLEATKGDATQLTKLFGDKQARDAARVVLQWLDKINEKQRVIAANAPKVIDENNARILKDTKTQLDMFWESWAKFKTDAGGTIAPVVKPILDTVNTENDKDAAVRAGLDKKGVTGRWNQEKWLLWNNPSEAERAGLMVDGGYGLDKQVLPELSYPAALPQFNGSDVPLPMPRPAPPQLNRSDVPIPMPRPARPGEAGFVAPVVPPLRPSGPENSFESTDRPMNLFEQDAVENAQRISSAIKAGLEEGGSSVSGVIRREAIENARAVGFAMKAAFGDAQPAVPAAPSAAPSGPDHATDVVPREERVRRDARKNARDLGFAIDDADVEVRDRPRAESADTAAPAATSFARAALEAAQSIAEKFSAARADLLRVASAREPGLVAPPFPSGPDHATDVVPREERVRRDARKNARNLGFAIDEVDGEVRDRPKATGADAAAPVAPERGGFDEMLRGMNRLAGDLSEGGATAAQEIIDAAAAIGPAGASGGQQFGDAAALGITGAASRIKQEILDAGAAVAAQISAALSRGVTVKVSGGGAVRLPDPTGNRGRTMPNAGVPGVP